jgi:hypothetical protein
VTVDQYDDPRGPLGLSRSEAYEDAIRGIAAAVVDARRRADTMGRLNPEAASHLLGEVEHQLGALVAAGYVPPPPDPRRRRLTA